MKVLDGGATILVVVALYWVVSDWFTDDSPTCWYQENIESGVIAGHIPATNEKCEKFLKENEVI